MITKKFKILLGVLFAIVIVAAIAFFNIQLGAKKANFSDIFLSSITALAKDEGDEENYGPVHFEECGGPLNFTKKKICMCEPDHPACTETDCF